MCYDEKRKVLRQNRYMDHSKGVKVGAVTCGGAVVASEATIAGRDLWQ
jgi:hypothetical protein